MRLLNPGGYLVDTRFLEFELVLFEDFANLLLQTLRLLVLDVCNQIETSLAQYRNDILGNTNLGPLGYG